MRGGAWRQWALAALTLVAMAGCSSSGAVDSASVQTSSTSPTSTAVSTSAPPATSTAPSSGTGSSSTPPSSAAPSGRASSAGAASGSTNAAAASGPPAQDALAGVLSHDVPQVGTGQLTVVPGAASAPGPGTVRRIRVSVEGGLPVNGQAFASFVFRTLNDPRSWTHDGYVFARTDGDFDTEVVLASPDTSRAMCRPLETMGTLSCRNGREVVLTWYRWVNGQEDFGGDLTAYRQYLVNHEVGHSLGHGHAACPGAGQLAPVMMQQTKGVKPCVPNPWPYP